MHASVGVAARSEARLVDGCCYGCFIMQQTVLKTHGTSGGGIFFGGNAHELLEYTMEMEWTHANSPREVSKSGIVRRIIVQPASLQDTFALPIAY